MQGEPTGGDFIVKPVFMAIVAAFKLECLSLSNKLNPFALCRKLLINASRSAYEQLQLFRATA